jgi:hypothetical protein
VSNKVVWQGSFDMLCGIYCAAHLIACFKVRNSATPENHAEFYENAAETAFYHLMISVENLGMLTAQKLAEPNSKKSGYSDKQLEKIFNHLTFDNREGLKAVAFCRAKIKNLKGSERRAIMRKGACAIVYESGENHWITIEGKHQDGGYCSFDPSIEGASQRVARISSWSKGVFIVDPIAFED